MQVKRCLMLSDHIFVLIAIFGSSASAPVNPEGVSPGDIVRNDIELDVDPEDVVDKLQLAEENAPNKLKQKLYEKMTTVGLSSEDMLNWAGMSTPGTMTAAAAKPEADPTDTSMPEAVASELSNLSEKQAAQALELAGVSQDDMGGFKEVAQKLQLAGISQEDVEAGLKAIGMKPEEVFPDSTPEPATSPEVLAPEVASVLKAVSDPTQFQTANADTQATLSPEIASELHGISPSDLPRHDIELHGVSDATVQAMAKREKDGIQAMQNIVHRVGTLESAIDEIVKMIPDQKPQDDLFNGRDDEFAAKTDALNQVNLREEDEDEDEDAEVMEEKISPTTARKLANMKRKRMAKAQELAACVRTCERHACSKCPGYCKADTKPDANFEEEEDPGLRRRRRRLHRKRRHATVSEEADEDWIPPAGLQDKPRKIAEKFQKELSADDTAGYVGVIDPLRLNVEGKSVHAMECPTMFIDCALTCKM